MTYQAGETLQIIATITDGGGVAADPVTTVISIKKSDGTLDIDEVAMIRSETGIYYYDYLVAEDTGLYYTSIKATGSTGRTTIEPGSFMVGAAI